jgi:hypothetical protein
VESAGDETNSESKDPSCKHGQAGGRPALYAQVVEMADTVVAAIVAGRGAKRLMTWLSTQLRREAS